MLTDQQKLFVQEYQINGNNATQAYIKATGCSYDNALKNAHRWTELEGVKSLLEKKEERTLKKYEKEIDVIIVEVKSIIDKCKINGDTKHLLKALDQLAKLMGAYVNRTSENETTQQVLINIIAPTPRQEQ